MSALRAGEDGRWLWWSWWWNWRCHHLHLLVAQHLDPGPPMLPARPVAPEQRGRASLAGMEQHAHAARVLILLSVPLTLRTFRADATVSDSSLGDDTQAGVLLSTAFLREEHFACWTTSRSICLERKGLA